VFALDAGAGVAGDGGDACVGGQVPGGLERGGVADFEQDAGGGPDPDAGHGGQDPGKRVCIEYPSTSAATVLLCSRTVFRLSASLGRTVSAAAVPGLPRSAHRGRP